MDLAPAAKNATTFRLALMAMLISVWMIGRASDRDPAQPITEDEERALVQPDPVAPPRPLVKDAPPPAPPPAPGHLHGVVRFAGERPQATIIDMSSDPYCRELYNDDEPLRSEQWIWGANGTLANVLVYVSAGLTEELAAPLAQPAPPVPVLLRGCRITPHVTAVSLGQVLEFHSLDSTVHALHVKPQHHPPTRHGIPAPGISAVWQPLHTEIGIPVECDVHPWMRGYVHVLPHTFFDVTGDTGAFDIRGLPPGEYQLSLWHEVDSLTATVEPITFRIEAGKTTQLVLTVGVD